MALNTSLKNRLKKVELHVKDTSKKSKDLIVFVGSEEVIVNGEWLPYNVFKERYARYITSDWKVNTVGWSEKVTFPEHWHVIAFTDDTMQTEDGGQYDNN